MASFPHALPPDIDDFNTLTFRVKADGMCVSCACDTHIHAHIFCFLFARAHTHIHERTCTRPCFGARVHTCTCGDRD
jgi:hypothetical protein